jgi:2-polyprenyl-6-hydroxyphenyl methylase/3-demethylubiquinone-9 3-methyltransferase
MNEVRLPYFDEQLRAVRPARGSWAVLDVGCGGGLLTEPMAALGYYMHGVDMHEEGVVKARAHAASRAQRGVAPVPEVRLQYSVGNAYALPFEDASFDAIVCSDVFEHLHDLRLAVKEMHRVLRPGGVLVFDTISRTTWSYWLFIIGAQELNPFFGNVHDWRMFVTPGEMQTVLTDTGFDSDTTQVQGFSILPRWPMDVDIAGDGFPGGLVRFMRVSDSSGSFLGVARKPQ